MLCDRNTPYHVPRLPSDSEHALNRSVLTGQLANYPRTNAVAIPSQDPIVVAPSPTPFRRDDTVDFAAIEHNVARWLKTPLSGFVLNSENGEEAFLSESEQLEIVRTVQRVNNNRKLLIAGIDNPSVRETLRIADSLVSAGAELVRIRIPRLTSNLDGYFDTVIPRIAVPVLIIHQMAPGTFLSHAAPAGAEATQIGDWVARDNVFGYIASADLRFEARVRSFITPAKRFWAGNGSLLLAGVAVGANGACMMLGNVAPQECCDIVRHAMAGELKQAQTIQDRVLELDWQILARRAAGLKVALTLLGFDSGLPRSPSQAGDDQDIQQIREALRRAGLLT